MDENIMDLERKIATIYNKAKTLRYENLIIETPGGFHDRAKVKAVRTPDGKIDILETFRRAGIKI